jgi:hypothetical protein
VAGRRSGAHAQAAQAVQGAPARDQAGGSGTRQVIEHGKSGCRAICAKSAAAIRSENGRSKDHMNSRIFFRQI